MRGAIGPCFGTVIDRIGGEYAGGQHELVCVNQSTNLLWASFADIHCTMIERARIPAPAINLQTAILCHTFSEDIFDRYDLQHGIRIRKWLLGLAQGILTCKKAASRLIRAIVHNVQMINCLGATVLSPFPWQI